MRFVWREHTRTQRWAHPRRPPPPPHPALLRPQGIFFVRGGGAREHAEPAGLGVAKRENIQFWNSLGSKSN